MRVLIDNATRQTVAGEVDDDRLHALYAPPHLPWFRVNMISTVDGAATGGTGKSGDINNPADKRVFDLLRATADVIVVGAGTARIEGYGEAAAPIVVVSRRGEVPEGLRHATPGKVLLATCARAAGLASARAALGDDQVIVVGDLEVDLAALRSELLDRGFQVLLSEGGPHLLGDLLASGVVDELCVSVVPRLVGGPHPRITVGGQLGLDLELSVMLVEDGTLLGRWVIAQPARPRSGV
jgi:riboflavin biosynthesis pyrimidine reductase